MFPALLLYKGRQIYAEAMPSISKESFGVLWDFKGLQGPKSENDVSPNFCPAEWA
jgi:hypothetical protein